MRKLAAAALLLAACSNVPSPAPSPAATSTTQNTDAAPPVYGFTVEEEARVLMLEDRREFDPAMAQAWIANPNALHRVRMALALARIGPHTFIDANNNGERDPGERQAGVSELVTLTHDSDRVVRETAAFALGEIGDPSSIDALFEFAHDSSDAGVAAVAIEALSKLAQQVPLARYRELTTDAQKEGARAVALQYLFRFGTDDASAIAAAALESPSPLLRERAAYALSRRAYAPARAQLELLATDPNVLTRSYVVAALGRIASKESLPVLLDTVRDAHPWVRTNSLIAIARVAAKDPQSLVDRETFVRDALQIVALSEDPDNGTRASAIDTLGYYAVNNEGARKRLFEIAANGSRWNRELAAGAIARHFGDAEPNALTTITPDRWGIVRILEASTAMKNGAALRKQYANDRDPLIRANALSAIPEERIDAELDLITPALDADDVIVRATAIDNYAKSKSPDLRVLYGAEQRGRADFQNDARLSAITAIAAIDDPRREEFLRGLLKDADPVVRRVAADQIEQKLKKPRPQFTPLPVDRALADYVKIVQWAHQPHTASIHLARGTIDIGLGAQDAPMTAWNFAQLANREYFHGTSFMRVVPNFVIQGGDPRGDMSGGPGYAIRDEINLQKYTRGAVGMALSGPDTGGSQFFITHSPQPHLDGGYTIFGRVFGGLSVVDQTERGDAVESIVVDEKKDATPAP